MGEINLKVRIFGTKVTIIRHYCIDKMMTGKGCSLHIYWAHCHYFTLFDKIRIVIGTPRGDINAEKLVKWQKTRPELNYQDLR